MKPRKNTSASVAARLLNRARAKKEDYQFLLTRYALERLLWRLSQSSHADSFILKGAMLFLVWTGEVYRPTKDLDLLAKSTQSAERLGDIFRELCAMECMDDGLRFTPESVAAAPIREEQTYGGIRVTMMAHLINMRIPVQVDVGFGDAVTPEPAESVFPVLLDDSSAPTVRAYNRETAIAEKFEAIVSLGMANSRMKDYYDIFVLQAGFAFDEGALGAAIRATFVRRGTEIPLETPVGLSAEFAHDAIKATQWKAFRNKSSFTVMPPELPEVVRSISEFLARPMAAAVSESLPAKQWSPGGPWR